MPRVTSDRSKRRRKSRDKRRGYGKLRARPFRDVGLAERVWGRQATGLGTTPPGRKALADKGEAGLAAARDAESQEAEGDGVILAEGEPDGEHA